MEMVGEVEIKVVYRAEGGGDIDRDSGSLEEIGWLRGRKLSWEKKKILEEEAEVEKGGNSRRGSGEGGTVEVVVVMEMEMETGP